ncbi:uncharacterized protein LOC142239718 [Haematobia irritans]|uniref:uncharacterized protein LOC142239710 n=1 Tax=Haematobia irritans TaxID=7368 RepID=UPI003F507A10
MHTQRFLWWDKNDLPEKPSDYVMCSLTFGISCAPCIAHYVRDFNADQFKDKYTRAVTAIQHNHYVDDFIDSVDREEEAIEWASQVKLIHAAAGFHIRNWSSNNDAVTNYLEEITSAEKRQKASQILKRFWICQTSARHTHSRNNSHEERTVASSDVYFRSTGLYIMLYNNTQNSSSRTAIDRISAVEIPRCYSQYLNEATEIELHTFVDAGEDAYAAVCYIRIFSQHQCDIAIIAGKSKVAPLKPMSISRLELQAAIIGVRIAQKVLEISRLNFTSKYFWIDSKTVLQWLRMNPKKFQQFVMHRVGEILEVTNVTQWRWVPSKMNPADLATKYQHNWNVSMWFTGPQFLRESKSTRPECVKLDVCGNDEIRHNFFHIHKDKAATLNVEYFSNWRRLYRAVATFILYVNRLKMKRKGDNLPN